MIPKLFIQELLAKLDIVDVIESHIPLKKRGSNYACNCPFHNEKSASFIVQPRNQFYHCFGCGVHGNVITFLIDHLGINYPEAISILAGLAGMTVPVDETVPEYGLIAETMTIAANAYHTNLLSNEKALDYLFKRGVSIEIIEKFKIGFAPDKWNFLKKIFPDYNSKLLVEAGLVYDKDGKKYDRFRDRIMFPILNSTGRIIAFGGRVLNESDEKNEAKYLNSPETPLFEKSKELYGLHAAKKSIQKIGLAIVVEGYMDVVSLHQHGIKNSVATLGTATSQYHISKLLKLTNEIVFCFDGDTAGRKAARRAMENVIPALQDGKSVRFMFLQEGYDPDKFVREFGKSKFLTELESATLLSQYLINEASEGLNLATTEGKTQFITRSKLLLASMPGQTTALLIQHEIAKITGLPVEKIDKVVNDVRSQQKHHVIQKNKDSKISPHHVLLQCLLMKPELGKLIKFNLSDKGADADCISIALEVLQPEFMMPSSMLVIQLQETSHSTVVQKAIESIVHWPDSFNIEAEFEAQVDALKGNDNKENRQLKLSAIIEKVNTSGLFSLLPDEWELLKARK